MYVLIANVKNNFGGNVTIWHILMFLQLLWSVWQHELITFVNHIKMHDKQSWWGRNVYALCTCFCIAGGEVKTFWNPLKTKYQKYEKRHMIYYFENTSAGEMKKYIHTIKGWEE